MNTVILWDDAKRQANIAKHGFDFATLSAAFFLSATILEGNVPGRFVAIGHVDGTPVAVAFRPMGREAVSVVSMRHASKRERKYL